MPLLLSCWVLLHHMQSCWVIFFLYLLYSSLFISISLICSSQELLHSQHASLSCARTMKALTKLKCAGVTCLSAVNAGISRERAFCDMWNLSEQLQSFLSLAFILSSFRRHTFIFSLIFKPYFLFNISFLSPCFIFSFISNTYFYFIFHFKTELSISLPFLRSTFIFFSFLRSAIILFFHVEALVSFFFFYF